MFTLNTLKKLKLRSFLVSAFFLIAYILAGILVVELLINHDSASYLAFAQLILFDRRDYENIYEINTPLIVYISMIPVWLSNVSGISEITLFIVMVGLLALVSMHLCWKLSQQLCISTRQEWMAAALIVTIMLIMPTLQDSYGQREHLLIIFILPYLFQLIADLRGMPHTRRQRITTALFAAIGFAIKPHFILIFAAAECARALVKRNFWTLFRFEAWIISLIFLGYHAYLIIAYRDYMLTIWPMVMASYAGYQVPLLFVAMTAIFYAAPSYFMIVYAIRKGVAGSILFLLGSVVVASALVFMAPMTNYIYQALPLIVMQCLLGGIVYLQLNKVLHGCIWIMAWSFLSIGNLSFESTQRRNDLAQKIEEHANHQTIAIISSSTSGGFPITNYGGAYWGLSLPYMIHLPLAYADSRGNNDYPAYHTRDEMDKLEQFFTDRTLDDLEKLPVLVIFDEREEKQAFTNMKFNFLDYFQKQERFRALWKDYRYIGTLHDFAFYKYEQAAKP